jgi:hypothetical protein
MTLVVAWYREKFGQLWVAADTRISGEPGVLTDHGPKIFQIPVVCRKTNSSAAERRTGEMSRLYRTNYGLAFAGSTLSALGTHALASACCQNLAANKKIDPPSVEDVANLYRKLGEIQIREMCSRIGPAEWPSRFFKAYIFGHCLKARKPEIFALHPRLVDNKFDVAVERIIAVPNMYYPMGSGTNLFVEMHKRESALRPDTGVFQVLQKMVRTEVEPTVGGHTQVAVVTKFGVELRPVLILGDKPHSGHTTFLGVAADLLGGVGGFQIGYFAVGPDLEEIQAHAARIAQSASED